MIDISKLDIKSILKSINNKEISITELIELYIKKVDKLDKYNLVSEKLYEEALLKAKIADQKKIDERGALEGIPIAVKDIFCTEGNITSASSNILKNFRSPYESTVTKNLKEAGAIVLCKTTMDEFAMGSASDTCNQGKVINPWTENSLNPLTPGGSSGGSAAIMAASGACFSLGTDTGGSIRQPASFCGVVGIKPTYGRCSRFGIIAFASSLDQAGTFSKNVEDGAFALTHMVSYDNKDSTSSKIKMPNLFENLKNGVKGLKIGIPTQYDINDIPTEIKKLWNKGKEIFKKLGAHVTEISLPHTKYALPTYYIIAPAEASANLARYDGVKYGFRSNNKYEDLNEMYCKTRGEGFGKEVKRRLLIGTYVLSSGYYDAYYLHAQKVRRKIVEDFNNVFKSVDLILTPTTPSDAFVIGEKKDDPISMYLNDIFTVPSSLAGLPALSLPGALSKNKRPLGLQLIANNFCEDTLLRGAYAIEQEINFNNEIALKN